MALGAGKHSVVLDQVYVVRWIKPDYDDVVDVAEEIRQAKVQLGEAPLYGVAIVPRDTAVPDDRTRASMSQAMNDVLTNLETMHVVFEGSGFRPSILRSVFAGVTLMSKRRGKVFVHGSIQEAIEQLAPNLEERPQIILRRLADHGLWHPSAASEVSTG